MIYNWRNGTHSSFRDYMDHILSYYEPSEGRIYVPDAIEATCREVRKELTAGDERKTCIEELQQ